MATIVWGLLEKSLVDNEKIEEAIARLILEHNEDETAHLGTGQSLQSHKASEIIDHVVDSIIEDKIKNGEITRQKLSGDAVVFITEDFDKGFIIDFFNFTSSVSGTGYISKGVRFGEVRTYATQNSVAKIYAEVDQAGSLWYCSNNLEIAFHYYISEAWGWETAPGGEIYLKYGMGSDADMGSASDKVFGIKLEDQADGSIKATGFARSTSNLSTVELATDLEATFDYIFTIKKVGSTFYFYIDGVQKGSFSREIVGTVANPLLVHVAKNPVAGSQSNGVLNGFGYYFPY